MWWGHFVWAKNQRLDEGMMFPCNTKECEYEQLFIATRCQKYQIWTFNYIIQNANFPGKE